MSRAVMSMGMWVIAITLTGCGITPGWKSTLGERVPAYGEFGHYGAK